MQSEVAVKDIGTNFASKKKITNEESTWFYDSIILKTLLTKFQSQILKLLCRMVATIKLQQINVTVTNTKQWCY